MVLQYGLYHCKPYFIFLVATNGISLQIPIAKPYQMAIVRLSRDTNDNNTWSHEGTLLRENDNTLNIVGATYAIFNILTVERQLRFIPKGMFQC